MRQRKSVEIYPKFVGFLKKIFIEVSWVFLKKIDKRKGGE